MTKLVKYTKFTGDKEDILDDFFDEVMDSDEYYYLDTKYVDLVIWGVNGREELTFKGSEVSRRLDDIKVIKSIKLVKVYEASGLYDVFLIDSMGNSIAVIAKAVTDNIGERMGESYCDKFPSYDWSWDLFPIESRVELDRATGLLDYIS